MNILWIEDRGSSVDPVKVFLEKKGYKILKALSVSTAIGIWEDKKQSIEFIIVDLNVSSEGLTSEQSGETQSGVLSGFIWLKYYVFPDINEDFKKNIVIYSNYIEEFYAYVHENDRIGIEVIGKQEDYAAKKLKDFIIKREN